jgi:type IV pilus assembly protein PilY1
MNTFSQMRRKEARQLFRQRGEFNVKPLAWALAALFALPVAQADVDIARAPVMLGGNLPPNVMILLDNSFSMGSGHMPTNSAYYGPTTGEDNTITGYTRPKYGNLAVRSSYVNKLAYNPKQKYEKPLKADGSRWGDDPSDPKVEWPVTARDGFGASIPDPENGGTDSAGYVYPPREYVDLSHDYRDRGYGGILHYNRSQPDNNGNCTTAHGSNHGDTTNTYTITGKNYCGHTMTDPASRSAYYTWFDSTRPGCVYTYGGKEIIKQAPVGNGTTAIRNLTGKNSSTNDNENGGESDEAAYKYSFQKCFDIVEVGSAKDLALTELSEAEAKQNFANWYSYYSTRINLLKSSFSQALQGIDSTVRIGFGVTGSGNGETTTGCDSSLSHGKTNSCRNGRAFKSVGEYNQSYLNTGGVYYSGGRQKTIDGLASPSAPTRGFYSIQRGVRPFRDIGDDLSMPPNYRNQSFRSQVFDYLFSIAPASIGDHLESETDSTTKTDRARDARNDDLARLRLALGEAGEYYRLADVRGPWSLYPGLTVADATPGAYDQFEKQRIQACRKSYTILVTTGQYEQSTADSDVEAVNQCARGDQDGTNGRSFEGGCSANGPSTVGNNGAYILHESYDPAHPDPTKRFLYQATATPFKDRNSGSTTNDNDNLADVAMAYWKNDLLRDDAAHPEYANNVPSGQGKDPDIAFWQHMNTVVLQVGESLGKDSAELKTFLETVSEGAIYTLTSSLHAVSPSIDVQGTPLPSGWGYEGTDTWGKPRHDAEVIPVPQSYLYGYDMVHAAVNSAGGYYSVSSPEDLTKALNDAVNAMAMDNVTFTTAPTNSGSTSPPMIYQPIFNSSDWTGTILGYRLCTAYEALQDQDPDSDTYREGRACKNEGDLWKTFAWNAAELREGSTSNAFSWKPPVTGLPYAIPGGTGISFAWSNLDSEQQTKLGSADVVEYLKGERSNEKENGGEFRDRVTEWFLGDIINSAPVFVGNDDFGFANAGGITLAQRNAYRTRKNTNRERMEVLYVGANDGMLHAFNADSRVDDTTLVAPAGRGGTELFTYVPNAVFDHLKDLSEPSYAHRYYVDGSPTVGDAYLGGSDGAWKTVLVGSTGAGGKAYYALDIENPSAFGAGNVLWEISNQTEDFENLGIAIGKASITRLASGKWVAIFGNGYNSDTNKAQLYIANLDNGGELVAESSAIGDGTVSNGLATPLVVDADRDGVAETAYAGDLQGNLWAFDLTTGSTTITPRRILRAKDSEGNPQPITAKPEAIRHSSGIGLMVYVGTGKIFSSLDKIDTSVQTFYGVYDKCGGKPEADCDDPSDFSRTDLLEQTILEEEGDFNTPVRVVSTEDYAAGAEKKGFYLDLFYDKKKGERVVAPPVVLNDRLLFNTLEPGTETECASIGDGWLYQLDPITGGRTSFVAFDLNSDGIFNDLSDAPPSAIKVGMNGGGVSVRGNSVYVGGKKIALNPEGDIATGRKIWFQIR